jgi:hypothetical protein
MDGEMEMDRKQEEGPQAKDKRLDREMGTGGSVGFYRLS